MRKKLLLALTLMLISLSSWGQTLYIGGHRAVFDEINKMWLFSIPQSTFGNDYTATVNYGDSISDFAIDSINVASGEEFVFEGIEGGKKYNVTAAMNDTTIAGYITFTWLPVVEFSGNLNEYFRYSSVIVNYPESTETEPMFAKIKWNETSGGNNKHNFTIKFLNEEDSTKQDRSLFGLRNDSTWIMDAAQQDFLRIRSRVNADLWLDMARKAWYADTLPDAQKGSRGKLVELIVNGNYMGIYNMYEPLDRKQTGIVPYDFDRKKFHGGMWYSYDWSRTVTMSNPKKRDPGMAAWDGFRVEYPDYNIISTVFWEPLENAVTFAPQADEFYPLRAEMGNYFDLPVMQDYYIFITCLQALDHESKNIYYACYDTEVDNRLTMFPSPVTRISLGAPVSPWDSATDSNLSPTRPVNWISHLPMVDMWGVPTYHNEVVDRYLELRETVLNTDSLVNRYRSVINDLMNCGAGAREQNRWSRKIDLAYKELNLVKEMDNVENWIRQRMEFLDNNHFRHVPIIKFIREDVNRDGEVNIADINALIDLIMNGTIIYNEDDYITGDANADDEVNIADINAVIEYILTH